VVPLFALMNTVIRFGECLVEGERMDDLESPILPDREQIGTARTNGRHRLGPSLGVIAKPESFRD
jgi:hypothetical protein